MTIVHNDTENYVVMVRVDDAIKNVEYVGLICPRCGYMLTPLGLGCCIMCSECKKYIHMKEDCIMSYDTRPSIPHNSKMQIVNKQKYHPNYGLSDYDKIIDIHLQKIGGPKVFIPRPVPVNRDEFKPMREWYYKTINGSVMMYIGQDVCDTTKLIRNKFIVINIKNHQDLATDYKGMKIPLPGDTVLYDTILYYLDTLGHLCSGLQIKLELGPKYE